MSHSKPSQLPASLQQAYQMALYEVAPALDAAHILRAGQHSPWLQQAYLSRQVSCASYLTACNPKGVLLGDAENALRMSALRAALHAQGWRFDDGKGRDPEGIWPGEDSVLVWGMGPDMAVRWGLQWQQNAVLWCGADAIPQLLWLR